MPNPTLLPSSSKPMPVPAGRGFWIAVASAEHVRRGRETGFMQVCHGRPGPLRRIQPGDGVVYYSPTTRFGGTDRLQSFTAIGNVAEGEPYLADMGGGFHPWRRNVIWAAAQDATVRPLLGHLSFAVGRANWGAALRFGLLAIGGEDFRVIAQAMSAVLPAEAHED